MLMKRRPRDSASGGGSAADHDAGDVVAAAVFIGLVDQLFHQVLEGIGKGAAGVDLRVGQLVGQAVTA